MKLIALFAVLGSFICATATAHGSARSNSVEDIYVVRSLRLSRTAPGTYCAERRTGFATTTLEDRYDFKAVTARAADGRVTNVSGPTVGHLHACFGATADSLVERFYAEGDLNGVRLTGRGECRTEGRESPEPGITPWRCYLDLGTPSRVRGRPTDNEHRRVALSAGGRFGSGRIHAAVDCDGSSLEEAIGTCAGGRTSARN